MECWVFEVHNSGCSPPSPPPFPLSLCRCYPNSPLRFQGAVPQQPAQPTTLQDLVKGSLNEGEAASSRATMGQQQEEEEVDEGKEEERQQEGKIVQGAEEQEEGEDVEEKDEEGVAVDEKLVPDSRETGEQHLAAGIDSTAGSGISNSHSVIAAGKGIRSGGQSISGAFTQAGRTFQGMTLLGGVSMLLLFAMLTRRMRGGTSRQGRFLLQRRSLVPRWWAGRVRVA